MKALSSTISSDLSYQPQRIRIVAAEIEKDGQILITQRREKAVYPLYWEFPSGKVDHDESDEEALRREVEERLGIHVKVSHCTLFVTHHYQEYSVDFYLYQCCLQDLNEEIRALKVKDWRWIHMHEIQNFPFPPADAQIFKNMQQA
jgi:8-oxo-dGTP diphosphatase